MATMHVEIVSAEREIFAGEAEMVVAPGILGEVGILPGHVALLTQLRPGEVRVQLAGGEHQEVLAGRSDKLDFAKAQAEFAELAAQLQTIQRLRRRGS